MYVDGLVRQDRQSQCGKKSSPESIIHGRVLGATSARGNVLLSRDDIGHRMPERVAARLRDPTALEAEDRKFLSSMVTYYQRCCNSNPREQLAFTSPLVHFFVPGRRHHSMLDDVVIDSVLLFRRVFDGYFEDPEQILSSASGARCVQVDEILRQLLPRPARGQHHSVTLAHTLAYTQANSLDLL